MSRPGRYFEDYQIGEVVTSARQGFTEAGIIDFARRYDPQSFHVDPVAAEQSYFGGLIGSGWHTLFTLHRLIAEAEPVPGPGGFIRLLGFEDLRWSLPVRLGDQLQAEATVLELQGWPDQGDRGVVVRSLRGYNQDAKRVCSITCRSLVLRRTAL